MTLVPIQHQILTNEYWFKCGLITRAASNTVVYFAMSISWLRGHDPLPDGKHSFEVLDSICYQTESHLKGRHNSRNRNMSCTGRITFGD
jgi:hypothetical protein